MVNMTKNSPRPKSGAVRVQRRATARTARRTGRKLLDLSGVELYAVMSYRLAMAVIVMITVLHLKG
jgi:hypothetical protein